MFSKYPVYSIFRWSRRGYSYQPVNSNTAYNLIFLNRNIWHCACQGLVDRIILRSRSFKWCNEHAAVNTDPKGTPPPPSHMTITLSELCTSASSWVLGVLRVLTQGPYNNGSRGLDKQPPDHQHVCVYGNLQLPLRAQAIRSIRRLSMRIPKRKNGPNKMHIFFLFNFTRKIVPSINKVNKSDFQM